MVTDAPKATHLVDLPGIARPRTTNPTDPPLTMPGPATAPTAGLEFREPTVPAGGPTVGGRGRKPRSTGRPTADSSPVSPAGAASAADAASTSTRGAASRRTSTSTDVPEAKLYRPDEGLTADDDGTVRGARSVGGDAGDYGIDTNPPRAPRWTASGDPDQVAVVVGGLIAVAARAAARWHSWRGREFRRPTEEQRDAIAHPIARILCRHFPLGLIDNDLADAMTAVLATEDYIDDGPLSWPRATDLSQKLEGDLT